MTTNAGSDLLSVELSSPALTGNHAMQVHTWDPGFGTFAGSAIARFPYTHRPDIFSACSMANAVPGDRILIIVALSQGDSIIASPLYCTFGIDTNITQDACMGFPITYNAHLDPDSATIIVSAGPTGSPHMGTEIIVNDMVFGFNTGEAECIHDPVPVRSHHTLSRSGSPEYSRGARSCFALPARTVRQRRAVIAGGGTGHVSARQDRAFH